MKKFIRTLQNELPFAKAAKDAFYLRFRRLFRLPHEADFRALSLLPPLKLCLDIGANQGQSIESIRLFCPDATIIAFEANPQLAATLKRRYQHNPMTQIRDFGLSNVCGKSKLYVPTYNGFQYDALASMHREHAANWISPMTVYRFRPEKLRVEEFDCRTVTLDSLNLKPDFIKCDVEGLELEVLSGAKGTLTQHRPLILLEYSDEAPRLFLSSLGYKEFFFDGSAFQKGPSQAGPNSFFIPDHLLSAAEAVRAL